MSFVDFRSIFIVKKYVGKCVKDVGPLYFFEKDFFYKKVWNARQLKTLNKKNRKNDNAKQMHEKKRQNDMARRP